MVVLRMQLKLNKLLPLVMEIPNNSRIIFNNHLGTHIDFPYHSVKMEKKVIMNLFGSSIMLDL